MTRFKAWVSGAALSLAMAGAAVPASAQTSASLWTSGTGGSLTSNGLTFSVTGCTLQLFGVATDCNNAALSHTVLVATAVSGGVQLMFDNNDGSPLFSTSANADPGLTDLTLNLSITRAPRGVRITQVALGMTACINVVNANCTDTSSGNYEYLDAGFTFIGEGASPLVPPYAAPNQSGGTTDTFGVDPGNDTSSTTAQTDTVTSAVFAPVSSLIVLKDVHFNPKSPAGQASATPGSFIVLANFTQTYMTVPEPLTTGILMSGLVGLLVSRHRRVR